MNKMETELFFYDLRPERKVVSGGKVRASEAAIPLRERQELILSRMIPDVHSTRGIPQRYYTEEEKYVRGIN
jgi:hypothetical protein